MPVAPCEPKRGGPHRPDVVTLYFLGPFRALLYDPARSAGAERRDRERTRKLLENPLLAHRGGSSRSLRAGPAASAHRSSRVSFGTFRTPCSKTSIASR